MTSEGVTRRHALTGAATVGVGLPLLAACASGSSTADAGSAAPSPSSGPLGPTSDVPVGGGKVYPDQKVVVTQPTQGTFKGYSAVCTHQGCLVSRVEGGTIDCPCHLSRFSVEDGSVQSGPAPRPLPEVEVTVTGGQVSLA